MSPLQPEAVAVGVVCSLPSFRQNVRHGPETIQLDGVAVREQTMIDANDSELPRFVSRRYRQLNMFGRGADNRTYGQDPSRSDKTSRCTFQQENVYLYYDPLTCYTITHFFRPATTCHASLGS